MIAFEISLVVSKVDRQSLPDQWDKSKTAGLGSKDCDYACVKKETLYPV